MLQSFHKLTLCFALLSVSLILGGCNSATNQGWSNKKGGRISGARLISAQGSCHYASKRARSLRLLNTSEGLRHSNPRKARQYERRAASIIAGARNCMSRRGAHR